MLRAVDPRHPPGALNLRLEFSAAFDKDLICVWNFLARWTKATAAAAIELLTRRSYHPCVDEISASLLRDVAGWGRCLGCRSDARAARTH